jgi:hypothetical protein
LAQVIIRRSLAIVIISQAEPETTEIVIDIAYTFDPNTVDGVPARETQQQASRFRTDFDKFSDLEWQVLFDHGYSAARQSLSRLC